MDYLDEGKLVKFLPFQKITFVHTPPASTAYLEGRFSKMNESGQLVSFLCWICILEARFDMNRVIYLPH